MRANVAALTAESSEHPILRRYAKIGRTISGQEAAPEATAIEAGIGRVTQMAVDLRIPRLGTLGLTPQHIPELAALARRASSMRYNPVVLSDDALKRILRDAL